MTSRRGDLPAVDPPVDEQGVVRPRDQHGGDAPDADPDVAAAPADGWRASDPPVAESSDVADRPAAEPPVSEPRVSASPSEPPVSEPRVSASPSDQRDADASPPATDVLPRGSRAPARGPDTTPTGSSSAEPRAADLPVGLAPASNRDANDALARSPAVRRDPFATAPLAALPPSAGLPTGGAVDARPTRSRPSPPPADPRADGGRTAAPLFENSPLGAPPSGAAFGGDAYADEASAPTLVDDVPTEAFPVATPAIGRHRADPDEDAELVAEWRAPRQASRVTMGLLAALLIALGFFAGVIVGRSAGTYTPGDGARPAVTGPARPGTLR